MDLQTLKKSRGLDFSKITNALTKTTETGFKNDDAEYFRLTKDKAGNGSAVIRFLPTAEGDDLPWVGIYSHGFQGPGGKWYIENCLSTLGEEDPVGTNNRVLWQGSEKDKEQARKQKRKLKYTSNVLVVSDPGNRENEGKVLKFEYGKKIFEMIMQKVQPTFEDETPVNVFDLWEGANFKLRMKQVEKYPNYDQSAFAEVSPVAETDEEILEIVKQQKPLKPLLDPKNFKSYEELEKKFKMVMSTTGTAPRTVEDSVKEASSAPTKPAKAQKAVEASATEEDSEDIEAYFANIANP
jgi:hypothetical protein